MPDQQACPACGQPVRFVAFGDQVIKLDVTPSYDAPFRLVGEEQNQAERVTRSGFYGYTDHEQTCPKKQIH